MVNLLHFIAALQILSIILIILIKTYPKLTPLSTNWVLLNQRGISTGVFDS